MRKWKTSIYIQKVVRNWGLRLEREVWLLSKKKVRFPYFFLETELKENMTLNGVKCQVAMSIDAHMHHI